MSGCGFSAEISATVTPANENDNTKVQFIRGQVEAGVANIIDLELAYASVGMSGLVVSNKIGNLDIEWIKLGNIEAGVALKPSGLEVEAHASIYTATATYDLLGANMSTSVHLGAIGFGTKVENNCFELTISFIFGFTISWAF